jgi:hypothetical protein
VSLKSRFQLADRRDDERIGIEMVIQHERRIADVVWLRVNQFPGAWASAARSEDETFIELWIGYARYRGC